MKSVNLNKAQLIFFLGLFLLAGGLMLFIFRFYFTPLILAVSLAVVFYPVYNRIRLHVIDRQNIASLLTVLLAVLVVIVPLGVFGGQLVREVASIYTSLAEATRSAEIVGVFLDAFQRFFPQINTDGILPATQETLQQAAGWLLRNVGAFFSATAQFIGDLLLALLAFFFFLRDGERLRDWFLRLSPLSANDNNAILSKLAVTVSSTIRGNIIVAFFQGLLVGVGFAIFGIPNAIFWGMVGVLAAVVPIAGTGIVIVPAVIYLWATGPINMAIGLLAWGVLLVGLFDNIMRPYLIEREINIHPLLVLLSVLGGIGTFGAIGFIVGPLILSLFVALFDLYPHIVLGESGTSNGSTPLSR